ncbi:MAG: molybdate ABC transporter substrate-binding protein [Pseudomonadota bacterium]
MFRTSLLATMLLLTASGGQAAEKIITVFAASSLTNVMDEAGKSFEAATGIIVRISPAASSVLARQIESGAPADVFISADQEWMDYLASRKLINPATRVNIVANSLVLVAPADSKLSLRIKPGFAIATALGKNGRIATGDPASVPVGKYARAALTQLGVWNAVKDRIIPADNVRTALNFVALGEAPLGIVYATDARCNTKVRVVDTFPASSHELITYPAAAMANAGADAATFVKFLRGDAAQAVFDRAGFGRP